MELDEQPIILATRRKKIRMKLNEFMNTYKGFDWKNGKIIIVKNNRPLIINGVYRITLKHHLEDRLLAFTHDSDTIVITLGD